MIKILFTGRIFTIHGFQEFIQFITEIGDAFCNTCLSLLGGYNTVDTLTHIPVAGTNSVVMTLGTSLAIFEASSDIKDIVLRPTQPRKVETI